MVFLHEENKLSRKWASYKALLETEYNGDPYSWSSIMIEKISDLYASELSIQDIIMFNLQRMHHHFDTLLPEDTNSNVSLMITQDILDLSKWKPGDPTLKFTQLARKYATHLVTSSALKKTSTNMAEQPHLEKGKENSLSDQEVPPTSPMCGNCKATGKHLPRNCPLPDHGPKCDYCLDGMQGSIEHSNTLKRTTAKQQCSIQQLSSKAIIRENCCVINKVTFAVEQDSESVTEIAKHLATSTSATPHTSTASKHQELLEYYRREVCPKSALENKDFLTATMLNSKQQSQYAPYDRGVPPKDVAINMVTRLSWKNVESTIGIAKFIATSMCNTLNTGFPAEPWDPGSRLHDEVIPQTTLASKASFAREKPTSKQQQGVHLSQREAHPGTVKFRPIATPTIEQVSSIEMFQVGMVALTPPNEKLLYHPGIPPKTPFWQDKWQAFLRDLNHPLAPDVIKAKRFPCETLTDRQVYWATRYWNLVLREDTKPDSNSKSYQERDAADEKGEVHLWTMNNEEDVLGQNPEKVAALTIEEQATLCEMNRFPNLPEYAANKYKHLGESIRNCYTDLKPQEVYSTPGNPSGVIDFTSETHLLSAPWRSDLDPASFNLTHRVDAPHVRDLLDVFDMEVDIFDSDPSELADLACEGHLPKVPWESTSDLALASLSLANKVNVPHVKDLPGALDLEIGISQGTSVLMVYDEGKGRDHFENHFDATLSKRKSELLPERMMNLKLMAKAIHDSKDPEGKLTALMIDSKGGTQMEDIYIIVSYLKNMANTHRTLSGSIIDSGAGRHVCSIVSITDQDSIKQLRGFNGTLEQTSGMGYKSIKMTNDAGNEVGYDIDEVDYYPAATTELLSMCKLIAAGWTFNLNKENLYAVLPSGDKVDLYISRDDNLFLPHQEVIGDGNVSVSKIDSLVTAQKTLKTQLQDDVPSPSPFRTLI